MSTRLNALVTTQEPQVVQIDANYAMQTYDQVGIVTVANVTVTLPQNPFPGESHILYADTAIGFSVTGAPADPLSTDPFFVAPGAVARFEFGITGWSNTLLSGSAAGLGTFGDGSDGAATLDGVAVVGWAGLVGTVYTMTRDAFLTNLTVSVGVTLKPAGFRLFVNGVLANAGTIERDGNAAALGVAGALLAAETLGASFAGGAGSAGVGVGAAGTNATQGLPGGTGAGGAGGAGGADAGGAAGTYTAIVATEGSLRSLPQAVLGSAIGTGGIPALQGGAGGGGGGADNAGVTGGGGGGGASTLMIAANVLVNSGAIHSTGGAGAAASGAGGNGGGGGGGGGGSILLVTRSTTGAGTITVAGGAGGAALGAGGVAGAAGAVGNIVRVAA